jgi:SAM-dependent methyltransferase
MSFAKSRGAYDRYMGRFSDRLGPAFVSFVEVEPGMRALDVGCGPGALTEVLAERLGADLVAAADPSQSFVAACSERVPGADVRLSTAEGLPWPDAAYDVVVSQLVLNFVSDADAALAQMCRVARPGAVLSSCTWDYAEGMQMLRTFWDAAREVDPSALSQGETMRYCTEEELAALWVRHGLVDVETTALEVTADYLDFDDFWSPFTLGVGPGGAYLATLDAERQGHLRENCRRRLGAPEGPFTLDARAVAVRGRRPA